MLSASGRYRERDRLFDGLRGGSALCVCLEVGYTGSAGRDKILGRGDDAPESRDVFAYGVTRRFDGPIRCATMLC